MSQTLTGSTASSTPTEKNIWPGIPPDLTMLFRCEVGSTVHGCGVDDQDDRDEMGICVPPREAVLGLRPFEQFIWRTQPEHVRSGPGDLDLTVYSARKWMRLAMAGNPTVLLPIFVQGPAIMQSSPSFDDLRRSSDRFIGRHVAGRYLGYMNSQIEQMMGLRGRKHTNRPELVAKYGYDTKFAYHALRLGIQGVEVLTTGKLTLPINEPERAFLLSVRRGEVPLAEAVAQANDLSNELAKLRDRPGLPQGGDHIWADQWLIRAHKWAWFGFG